MFKKFLCLIAALIAATAFAAVEANSASEADLDGIKGIGPSMSRQILTERAKRPFKDWTDLIDRLKGVGPKTALSFSSEGLTVNGSAFDASTAPAPNAQKQDQAKGGKNADNKAAKPGDMKAGKTDERNAHMATPKAAPASK